MNLPHQLLSVSAVGTDRERERARDAELVRAGLDGDRGALEQLVEHYWIPVYRAAYRIVHDAEASADVTQATFLSVFENLHRYDPAYKFFSWIYRIAVNQALDHIRRRQRADEAVQREIAPPSTEDASAALDEAAAGEVAFALIATLPEDYRVVLALRHYAELSYDEMAEVLGIPVKTVRSRLYTARQQLKTALEARGYGRSD